MRDVDGEVASATYRPGNSQSYKQTECQSLATAARRQVSEVNRPGDDTPVGKKERPVCDSVAQIHFHRNRQVLTNCVMPTYPSRVSPSSGQ